MALLTKRTKRNFFLKQLIVKVIKLISNKLIIDNSVQNKYGDNNIFLTKFAELVRETHQ